MLRNLDLLVSCPKIMFKLLVCRSPFPRPLRHQFCLFLSMYCISNISYSKLRYLTVCILHISDSYHGPGNMLYTIYNMQYIVFHHFDITNDHGSAPPVVFVWDMQKTRSYKLLVYRSQFPRPLRHQFCLYLPMYCILNIAYSKFLPLIACIFHISDSYHGHRNMLYTIGNMRYAVVYHMPYTIYIIGSFRIQ